jgi:hypothetical protein
MSAAVTVHDFSAPPPPVLTVEVAAEMLSILDTLTMAGQRHMMARITGLLAGEAQRRHRATRWFDGLARESQRMAPDVAAFRRQAEPILAALSL